jgi:septin family protein
MSSETDDKGLDEQEKQESPEGHATERGFGTGLRAQLQRRLNPDAEEPAAPAEQPDPSLVSYDFDTPAAAHVSDKAPNSEVEELRGMLADAQKRERELRAAFAEQVEAYERKLSEEFEVVHEQTKLDELSHRLSSTENEIREREQRLAAERGELTAE